MKILYHHRISSKDGQYVHIKEMIEALCDAGHDVILVGPRVPGGTGSGGELRLVRILKSWLPGFVYELLEFSYSIIDYTQVAKAIRSSKPDIIYERYTLFLPSGVWAKRKYNIPLLLEVNAPLYDERVKYGGISLRRLARWCERTTWRCADRILSVTHVLAHRIMREGIPGNEIVVTPNGINPKRIRTGAGSSVTKQKQSNGGRLVLGFVGFAREWHGLMQVIEFIGAECNPSLHFLLVGDGPACPGMMERARELGIAKQLTITGIVGHDEVASHVETFDIALQPSVVPYASPLKLLEYMALGRAIVAPDTDNVREILTDNVNSLLFDPDKPDDFGERVRKLCRSPELRDRLGVMARRTIIEKGLTWQANAQRVVELASRLCGK